MLLFIVFNLLMFIQVRINNLRFFILKVLFKNFMRNHNLIISMLKYLAKSLRCI